MSSLTFEQYRAVVNKRLDSFEKAMEAELRSNELEDTAPDLCIIEWDDLFETHVEKVKDAQFDRWKKKHWVTTVFGEDARFLEWRARWKSLWAEGDTERSACNELCACLPDLPHWTEGEEL